MEVKTDVDVLTDADCITMDDGDLRSGVKKMIDDRIGQVIDGAPEQLDTLKEIATELEKNQSGVSTILSKMNSKLEAKDLEGYEKTSDVDTKLKDKVGVVSGKGLSTNDFTDVDKQKLVGIEDGAQMNKVSSVNGMIGDVVVDIDLSEYVKKKDILEFVKRSELKPEAFIPPKVMTAVIDQNNPDSLACITYEDDAKGMSKGSPEWDKFFGTKLVLFKDGKEVRELKDEELNSLSPDDGDVMAKFSRKGLNIKTVDNKVYVSMTDNPNNSDFTYYAHNRGEEARDAFYLGAYLGYEQNGKLRSIKGVIPTGRKTIDDFRTIAQASGKGYEQLAFYQWTFLQAMYVLKYGNLDSQKALGKGLTGGSGYKNTGYTNGRGINYGTSSDTEQMRFQYIEDMWGNKLQWIDGIMFETNGTMKTNTDDFNDMGSDYKSYSLGTNEHINGFIVTVQGNNELGFIPKTIGGYNYTHYSDYSYMLGTAGSVAYAGGCYIADSNAGAFSVLFDGSWDMSVVNDIIGARLMFL